MRLDRIKLAGFKSFVDPTTIPLPGNLVGVVGPNGCGKSNIIDAVRWVMGESSAKHLRGDTMADVIFNGSATRKPVGVASVELVFDNSESPVPGEYAAYQKIAIKRSVGRDGQSTYQLNGTRCRRKDITDLFLGTGLGARSYAIIEQGTISRLIEAKPDELREIIEEAAGISRYKERRHETEIRMRHTEENLARLEDLRGELKKQVDNLQRQVKKAERYVALRDEERAAKAALLRLRWKRYKESRARQLTDLAAFGEDLRRAVSSAREIDERVAECRGLHEDHQTHMQQTQALFYEVGAEVGRLDDLIRRAEKSRQETLCDLDRLEADRARAGEELEHDRSQLEAIRAELAQCETALVDAEDVEHEASRRRAAAESTVSTVRGELEAVRSGALRLGGEADVLRVRGRQIDDQRRQLEQRRDRLESESRELEANLRHQEIDALRVEIEAAEAQVAMLAERGEQTADALREHQIQLRAERDELNQVRSEIHSTGGRLSSLELLQQHAMGKDRAALGPWLEQMSLRDVPRLAECLDVAVGWEDAVENVLGLHLEALCVSDVQPYLDRLSEITTQESVAFHETRPVRPNGSVDAQLPRLIDQVRSPWDLRPVLGSIFCAPDLAAARAACGQIETHESVVTPQGERAGQGWLAVRKQEDGKSGVIRRERDLRETKLALDQLAGRNSALEKQVAERERGVAEAEVERKALEADSRRLDREILDLKNQLHLLTARNEQASKRLQQLARELTELAGLAVELEEQRIESAESLAELDLRIEQSVERQEVIAQRLEGLERGSSDAVEAFQSAHEALRRAQSRREALRSSEQLTAGHLERARSHCSEADQRLEHLRGRYQQEQPLEDERARLTSLRAERQDLEQQLADRRRRLADLDRQNRELAEQRANNEREIDGIKELIERTRIELEGDQVRLQALEEQFDALGLPADDPESEAQEVLSEAAWQERISRLTDDVARLGPVNLMALDEYNETKARLDYLDEQHRDLSDSLATLLQAIEKIDRECRALFKETFDRINGGFQRMFPKLFGGGSASLELTERDFLDAGVSVTARPPGKRNSSIHLLSGGEKALTAVALVFAIFELNPAPFCLLDEVDAPLDDANVGRFCALVREMSERVQFLFISHNKVTMEIAQYLAGVTMKEPGVSRIVAVDLGEAVELITV